MFTNQSRPSDKVWSETEDEDFLDYGYDKRGTHIFGYFSLASVQKHQLGKLPRLLLSIFNNCEYLSSN